MKKYKDRLRRNPDFFKPENYTHYLTLKELAQEVDHDRNWLWRLEKAGRIPEPVRVTRGQLRIRLYSPEKVEEIKQILDSFRQKDRQNASTKSKVRKRRAKTHSDSPRQE